MKKIVLSLIVALVSIAGTAQAQVGGDVYVSPNHVEWRAYNSSYNTLYCSGSIFGLTQYGQWMNERINVVIPPNTQGNRFLRTYGNARFVRGDARVTCRN